MISVPDTAWNAAILVKVSLEAYAFLLRKTLIHVDAFEKASVILENKKTKSYIRCNMDFHSVIEHF